MAIKGGKGESRMAGTVALMVGLNASQARDAQDERVRESSQLTDDSGLGETKASPLQLPQRSYTQATEDEIEGIPSTVMAMQQQRQREERMKATAEQFAGAPTTPTVETPAEEQEEAGTKRRRAAEAEQEEAPSAGDYYAEQQKEAKKREAATEKRQSMAEERQQQYIKAKQQQLKTNWNFVTAALAATSFSVVGFVMLVGMYNAELINYFTFKNYNLIPKPEIPEVGRDGCVDLGLCCIILPVLLPGCFILAVVAGAAAYGISKI